MIPTLLHIGWLNLKRDYVALGLTFVLPIVFFSIFAVIFGGMGGAASGGTEGVAFFLVDLDDTETSRSIAAALAEDPALTVLTGPTTEDEARNLVRKGEAPVAVVFPKGLGESFGSFYGDAGDPVLIHYDEADPIARQIVFGMLQKAAMTAAPDAMMKKGIAAFEQFGGGLTEQQKKAVEMGSKMLREGGGSGGDSGMAGPIRAKMVDVRAGEVKDDAGSRNSMTAYYAAGIGVMFLLFSMAGAAGSLLEEEENGTLSRVLSSRVGMGTLLAGRWLFFGIVGVLQITIMFVWGAYAFGLDLFTANHLAGFVAMALVTSAAAAAFGILLATLCRTRAQLGGLSTIVILIMSALGGSMVPRFVMPPFMNTTALFTFNGWALDGFMKVFWYDDPAAGVLASLGMIVPELLALVGMTVAFLLLARIFARRWEAA